MKCVFCNNDFVPYRITQKYCSKRCNDSHYTKLHKKQKIQYDKIYRKTHKEQKYKTDKNWRINNLEKHNKQNRLWRKRHPEKNRLVQYNNYWNNARNNICFRIARNLRARIRGVLKGKNKSAHTLELLGCSYIDCWKYLQNQFKPGMTKENYGTVWNLDHIRPCASFDLSKESEQKTCFHYTNLQPLFVEENRKKGSKF